MEIEKSIDNNVRGLFGVTAKGQLPSLLAGEGTGGGALRRNLPPGEAFLGTGKGT